MRKNYRLLIVGAVVCTLFVVFLFFATLNTSQIVLTPSQVVDADRHRLGRMRVAGRVSLDPVLYQVNPEFKLEFWVEDRPPQESSASGRPIVGDQSIKKVKVVYEDIKPDMFTNGRDVLIDGHFENDAIIASSILTQCPSKYEPKDGTE